VTFSSLADVYPFADTIFRLLQGNFLRALSVGFKPWSWTLSTDPTRPGGLDFKKQELLEISVVPVPANANALMEARAKGIHVSDRRPQPPLKPRPQILLSKEAARRVRIAEAHEIAAQARALTRES
jgi:hypothetical protein